MGRFDLFNCQLSNHFMLLASQSLSRMTDFVKYVHVLVLRRHSYICETLVGTKRANEWPMTVVPLLSVLSQCSL
jgi:hypothetical protein